MPQIIFLYLLFILYFVQLNRKKKNKTINKEQQKSLCDLVKSFYLFGLCLHFYKMK